METQTPQIQRIESLEDLELLMQGDIVEVEGRKYPMKIQHNGRDKILNLVGRGGGESIQYIALEHSEVKHRLGKLILIEPYVESFFRNDWGNNNFYEFSKKILEEAGIWEKE